VFLGIDIGTSGVKAAVIDEGGALVAQAATPLTLSHPHPNWSEQVPDDWWRAAEAAVSALPAGVRRQVCGIGLAGQMHGATLLDAADRPLRPAILWNDGRSYAECAELERRVPQSSGITGNLAMPGFTAPKLLWVAAHEPKTFAQTATVLLPKDYVRLCMTGDKASDMSDSAGTLWLDCQARAWSDDMLAATGLALGHMPKLYEGPEPTGVLRAEVAQRWGMARVPVAAGAGDNAAGAIGIGVIADGDALLSLGTSGVTFVATDTFRPNPAGAVHAFCHCLPGQWHQMAVHLSAASCVDWAAHQLGLEDATALFHLAASEALGTGAELFLPYLGGERTPHNDPQIRAAWLGLGHQTTPAMLAHAVLEGVAFAFADGLAALRAAGTPIKRLGVIGGGARSRLWGEIIAAVQGVPLDYLDGGEVGPALGAARLGRMAATGEDAATVCTRPALRETIAPDAALAARLAPKLARYRAAYPALQSL
jgi:xylulokinase